ncbi:unnamed protein product [Peronospora effusa]|nr:unnamed protein product [Peronospora effusa]
MQSSLWFLVVFVAITGPQSSDAAKSVFAASTSQCSSVATCYAGATAHPFGPELLRPLLMKVLRHPLPPLTLMILRRAPARRHQALVRRHPALHPHYRLLQ